MKNKQTILYFAAFLTPILFCFFFARQVYFVYNYDFSVWKGGGMGMFSSLDHPSKRHLFYFTETDEGRKQVRFSTSSFDDSYTKYTFKVLPSPKNLSEVEKSFLDEDWYVWHENDEVVNLTRNSNDSMEESPYDLDGLYIELWKMNHIDSLTNTMEIRPVRTYKIDI